MSTVADRRVAPEEVGTGSSAAAERGTLLVYGGAIFLAAALLFVVQPMVGRMVLPRLGGSAEVWNTSMVFFQLALLAGYAYAHFTVRWLGLRRQILVHAAVLVLPVLVLPVTLPQWSLPPDGWQSPWLLALLCAAVGAPFFVLATASPLLQRWLASTGLEAAEDPYFLYASSNAGSLLGLLAYPLLVEPTLPLGEQSRLWSLGYGAFVLLVGLCAAATLRLRRVPGGGAAASASPGSARGAAGAEHGEETAGARSGGAPGAGGGETGDAPTAGDRLFWLACAFLPSSLLLAVTHHLTADVAPMPLLWVLPLAIYLGTFIVAFSRRIPVSLPGLSRFTAIVAAALAFVMLAGIREPVWAMILIHLGVLAVVGLLCHGRLARRRPSPRHLTEFYLLVAAGGVLGGAFNALLAPRVFDGLLEYPLAVAAACLLRLPDARGTGRSRRRRILDVALPAALGAALLLADVGADLLPSQLAGAGLVLTAAAPAFVCFLFSPRRVRFALGVAFLLAFGYFGEQGDGRVVHAERTFFGIHRVVVDPGERFTTLRHGGTIHGVQSTDPDRRREPLGYYHPSGPGGEVVRELAARDGERRIGLVGLGTGALAALASPADRLTLYEIDPAVVRIAEDPRFFTYLSDGPAPYEVVVGDGRIALEDGDRSFDLLVLDAFSSATVPVHLLTREAVEVYLSRLEPDGALLFHISSRHLDLGPVLGALAADLGLAASQRYHFPSDEAEDRGILSSRWVLLAREPADLEPYVDRRWRPLGPEPGTRAWTDDFADVLSVYRWN